jgi:DNA polymerase-3 subunit delta
VSRQLHLILGEEELLVERAVSTVLRAARTHAAGGGAEVPVNRLRAGEVSTGELAELLSPSLFADERVVILEAAGEAGKDAVAVIEEAAADLPEGTLLVVVHAGGGRAKALVDRLRKLGAEVHPCAKLTKHSERSSGRTRYVWATMSSRWCSRPSAPTSGNWRRHAHNWSPTPTPRWMSRRCAATTVARLK